MNKRKEELKTHLEKLTALKSKVITANQEYNAYGQAFNAWLHTELNFPKDQTADILLPEILSKWDEVNDNTPKIIS